MKNNVFDAASYAGITLINAENWLAFGHLLCTGLLADDVASSLTTARAVNAEDIQRAEDVSRRFVREIDAVLADCDAIVLLTMPCLAPLIDEAAYSNVAHRMTILVRLSNLSGHPAISLPIKATPGGPVSVQLAGRRCSDAQLCAIAQELFDGLTAQAQRAS